MPDLSLNELKKKAMGAVKHHKLVSLALDETLSINDVKKRANEWPQRQSKALIALTQIRAHYGIETLEKFLKELEMDNENG